MTDNPPDVAASRERRRRVVSRRPRVGNSCLTCRLRKVRCDEQRPSCSNCLQGARDCIYGSWEIDLQVVDRPNGPAWNQYGLPQPLTLETPRRNRTLHIDEREALAIEFFASKTRSVIVATPNPDDLFRRWADYVMASSIDEPALRSAMAAAGCVHSSTGAGIHTSLQRPVDLQKWELGLQLYNKALALLQRLVQRVLQGQSPIEPLLACCAVLFIFELYVGNDASAIGHSRFGRRIMQQHLRGQRPRDGTELQYAYVGLTLAGSDGLSRNPCAIGRYACDANQILTPEQSALFDVQAASLSTPLMKTRLDVGERLEALIRAGNHLQAELMGVASAAVESSGIQGMTEARRYCLVRKVSRSVSLDGRGELEQTIADVTRYHEEWRQHAHWLLNERPLTPVFLMLHLRFLISNFNIATSRTTSETDLDVHDPTYTTIIDLICAHFAHNRDAQFPSLAAAPVMQQPHNAGIMDFCITSSLLIVASKCRESSLRHKALNLLRDARRGQGVRVTRELEAFAHAVVAVEEDQTAEFWGVQSRSAAAPPEWTPDQVPEQARFSDAVLSLEEDDCLVCAYSALSEDGSIRMIECKRAPDGSRAVEEMQYRIL